VGPPLGNVLANAVLGLLAFLLSEEAFNSWGWRVAFLLSAALVAFGLGVRLRLEETPVFRQIAERGEAPSAPIREVLRDHPRGLASGMLSRVGPDVLYAMFVVFVLTYATDELGFSDGQAIAAVIVGSLIEVPLIPFAGSLSDRVDRRRVYAVAAVAAGVGVGLPRDDTLGKPAGADRGRQCRPRPACVHVRPPGRLHRRAVPCPAPIHRHLAGLHLRRHHRRCRGPRGHDLAPVNPPRDGSRDESGRTVAIYVGVAMLVTLVGLWLGQVVLDEVDEAPKELAAER